LQGNKEIQIVEVTKELSLWPKRQKAIKATTASDTVLESLCEVVNRGWPD